jgi:hypothetical protein
MSADGVLQSGITGATHDYTQYRPRGHYAQTPELERYFRAMTFLGGSGLPLFGDGKPITANIGAAALITLALDSTGDKWRSFEAPIDFLIGNSDDAGVGVYRDIVREAAGSLADAANLGDRGRLELLAEKIKTTVPSPLIQDKKTGNVTKEEEEAGRTPEFRISGKRFTFDAYIFHLLTSPRVGSDENPRNLPEVTDVMAVLGSDEAVGLADGNSGYARYPDNMRHLREEADRFIPGVTLYAMWLDALRESFKDSGSGQFFYKSGAWGWKKLSTASASWAELKHDTVLYAKQGGAEMGSGGWYAGKFAPPQPRGYVEPDPQTFRAISDSIGRLTSLITRFRLEDGQEGEYAYKLRTLGDLCRAAMNIAERQVRDEPLSGSDYTEIKRIARSFTSSLLMPEGMSVDFSDWRRDLSMAVVSDVATDFQGGRVLYAATGTPRRIFVYVNDRTGGSRITRGFVYSYYEFARPLSDGRMTDAEWKDMVYDAKSADETRALHPAWYDELFVR